MNIAQKLTKETNKTNKKIDKLNEKISPIPVPKMPEIKEPSQKFQKTGAALTATLGVGALITGAVIIQSKWIVLGGLAALAGAAVSYGDSRGNTNK